MEKVFSMFLVFISIEVQTDPPSVDERHGHLTGCLSRNHNNEEVSHEHSYDDVHPA